MKRISEIRKGLDHIGALTNLPPESDHIGDQQGAPILLHRSPESEDWDYDETFSTEDYLGGSIYSIDEHSYGKEVTNSQSAIQDFDPIFEIGPDIDEYVNVLGGVSGKEIRKSVELHGVDALGYYLSFHQVGYQWGVYVKWSGVLYLANNFLNACGAPLNYRILAAFHAILSHELFHFATDYMVSQLELFTEEVIWKNAKEFHKNNSPNYCLNEEKMANAYVLKAMRSAKPALRFKGKQQALKRFVELQPDGYRQSLEVNRGNFGDELAKLANCYLVDSSGSPLTYNPHLLHTGSYDWPALFPIYPKVDWRYCPIHLVDDSERFNLPSGLIQFFGTIDNIKESDTFLKMLKKESKIVQQKWFRTKQKLRSAITVGLDLKKWPKLGADAYSVRVDRSYRAHLKYDKNLTRWIAVEIGDHKSMGHG